MTKGRLGAGEGLYFSLSLGGKQGSGSPLHCHSHTVGHPRGLGSLTRTLWS